MKDTRENKTKLPPAINFSLKIKFIRLNPKQMTRFQNTDDFLWEGR
jgi:hypothetical protein